MSDASGLLARIERRAIWIAAAAVVIALVVPRLGPPVAAGVVGGAMLSALSYWAIKRGVDGLSAASIGSDPTMISGASARARSARGVMMLVARYALLALIAYVMIARLRLSLVGLVMGASVIPAAASIEAIGFVRKYGKV